jgi:hypothetical protein
MKLASIVFTLLWTPLARRKALSESYATHAAKNAKNDLQPTGFLKGNFYFETEGVYSKLPCMYGERGCDLSLRNPI